MPPSSRLYIMKTSLCLALCILWIGVMDWSHGLEPWIVAMEWSIGVDSWSGILEGNLGVGQKAQIQ